jgi:hypothetical protein
MEMPENNPADAGAAGNAGLGMIRFGGACLNW